MKPSNPIRRQPPCPTAVIAADGALSAAGAGAATSCGERGFVELEGFPGAP
jgi:hypothetical protein